MTTLERIDALKRLWSVMVPTIPCPDDSQLWLWISQHDDRELEHALNRLRSKVHHGTLQGDSGRYVTSVLNAERRAKVGVR